MVSRRDRFSGVDTAGGRHPSGGGATGTFGPCGRVERNLSAILDALSRSRGALSPRRAVAQRRSRASGLTRPLAEAISGVLFFRFHPFKGWF